MQTTTTQNILFLITLALSIVLAAVPTHASDAFLYSQDTNRIVLQNGVLLTTAMPTTSSSQYISDRSSTRYYESTTYTNGYTTAYGYSMPRAYTWRCFGSGCSKTPYLDGARTLAAHPEMYGGWGGMQWY